jgi:hypothetical protein
VARIPRLDGCLTVEGTYSAVTAGAAVVKGAGVSSFENNKGMFISLKSKNEGPHYSSRALSGFTIEFVAHRAQD